MQQATSLRGAGRLWRRLRRGDSRVSERESLSFRLKFLFSSPPPPAIPLEVDGCVSGLLCGGQRDNTHNGDLGSKRFGIIRLRGARLAKIFIRGGLRIKHSGHKG